MASSKTEEWLLYGLIVMVIMAFVAVGRDYYNGKDMLIIGQVVDKLHEHTVTQEANYDEEGNVTWEEVERDYYWLFCLREDGKSLKHDTGSRWVFNKYKVGQKIVSRFVS